MVDPEELIIGPPMSNRLDPDLKAALQDLADADNRSLNVYINRALRKHVDGLKKQPKAKG
jgi:predicted transcriptional regulator